MLETFNTTDWTQHYSYQEQTLALEQLEGGAILHFPQLQFKLLTEETNFLHPKYADPKSKNISYHAARNKLWGVQHLTDVEHLQLKMMLDRFSQHALQLTNTLLPRYGRQLILGRTSYRPVQISGRQTSYRKDDKRLHVDAFPSAPNQGKRILRVFTNIHPQGAPRIWRTGEPFYEVAQRFLPQIKKPFPGSARLLRLLRITKSRRTLYDHYMLNLHDLMKADEHYQQYAPQQEIQFPAGSTWIVQTDDVSHAAMKGQYLLEQTFYLPVHAMQDEARSPLRILENLLEKRLI